MAAPKHIARKRVATGSVQGIMLERPNEFFRNVSRALQKSLDLPFATTQRMESGTREVCYFRETNPVQVPGTGKWMPALPLYVGNAEEQSVWLVVEVECESGQPMILQQVSLKVHQGPTTETAAMCFRAEWDMRNRMSDHAQPHWNVHSPAVAAQHDMVMKEAGNFHDFVRENEQDTFANFIAADVGPPVRDRRMIAESVEQPSNGFTSAQMHRFHFAMAVDWHGASGVHSPEIADPNEIVRWIGACSEYVRSQFIFMMSLQRRTGALN